MADVRVQKKMGVGRHKSAIKRHRQSIKRRDRNRHIKALTKTAVKGVREAVAAGNKEVAVVNLKKTLAILQKAASKSVLPKMRVARLSSRLSKAVNNLS